MTKFTFLNKETQFNLSDKVYFGKDIVFGYNCRKIELGYGCFLGNDVYIDVPELVIGDYTTIHKHTTIHGYKPCRIGNNCWIGQFTVIDSIGGTSIGNNVGIGASSQLWSHIKFGDDLEGCRWNKSQGLIVEDDVWFVGHCIVTPIHARKKSMLMVGGVITKNMDENHVYAGVPAKDVTSVMGPQFQEVDYEEKVWKFQSLYEDFLKTNSISQEDFSIRIVDCLQRLSSDESLTYFCLRDRTYLPSRSEYEYRFMKYLLYDKAKFVPG